MHKRTAADLLHLLREAGGTISGEQLSRRLGISRAAIWKQIAGLRGAGYRIEAVPSRGYSLVAEPATLVSDLIKGSAGLVERIGRTVICTDETVSTNLDAFRLAEAGAAEGTVVLADSQSGGKGRLGRRWESPAGVNLYCSVILRPDLPPYEAPQLTFLSAVAVAQAIRQYSGLMPSIKWPNDLLLQGRKVAGLLNEMQAETDRVAFVILGIGINLNMRAEQFPPDLRYPATSLLLETGRQVDRNRFAGNLLQALDAAYSRFRQQGFEPLRQEWIRHCSAFGRQVQVDLGATVLRGPFGGIDHDGALLVQLPDGSLERVVSGDVAIVP